MSLLSLASKFRSDKNVIKFMIKMADKLPGGLADNVPDDVFPEDQLKAGIKEEMSEHTDDPEIAEEIVKDHLMEDPNKYL